MGLNETLRLDMTAARADIARLGKQLRDELGGSAGGFNITITGGATDELKQLAVEAKTAQKEIDGVNSDSIDGVAVAADGAANSTEKLAASWRQLATRAAALIGVREVFNFFRDSAREASDEVESLNAVTKVFDDSVGIINDFVENQATQLGFSGNAARQAAVEYGGLFQAFGFGQTRAAELSNELTKVAADLASIYNSDTSDAVRALSGIFRGEPEPARRFGLNITAAAIANEALNTGLIETKSQLDQNSKAQAVYQLILKQTENTTNDFADTLATSLPNQLRVLNAEFANFQADLGDQFQKPLTDGVKTIRAELIPALQDAVDNVNVGDLVADVVPPFVELVSTLVGALPAVLEVATSLGGVLTSVVDAAASLIGILPDGVTQFAAVAVAANSAEAAFGKFGSGAVIAADAFNRISKEGADATDKLVGFGEFIAAGALTGGGVGAAVGALAGGVSLVFANYREGQELATAAQQAYTAAIVEASPGTRSLEADIQLLTDAYRQITDAAGEATESILESEPALAAMQAVIAELGDLEQAAFADFRIEGGNLDVLADFAQTGTDILDDSGAFQRDFDLFGIDVAIENLDKLGDASDDPRVRAGVDAFLAYGEAVENDAGKLIVLADTIDRVADSADQSREATERDARSKLIAGVNNDTLSVSVLELARRYENDGVVDAYSRAVRESADAAELAAVDYEIMLGALSDISAGGDDAVDGLKLFAKEIDGSVVSAQGLVAALDGEVAAAVQGFLDDGIFGSADQADLSDLIISTGFDQRLREAGIKIDDFLGSVAQTVNERALGLAESFSSALDDRLANIASQLQIDFNVDEEDSIDDVEQLLGNIESTLADFDARRAAASELRILGLERLAQNVEQGLVDGIVDNINDGTADVELLGDIEAGLAEVQAVQEQAGAEAAASFELGFAEALATGQSDLMANWVQSFELSPEDFLEFGDAFQEQLEAAVAVEDAEQARLADGTSIGSFFGEGLIDGMSERTGDVAAAAGALGSAMRAELEAELGIQSPSTVGREIGEFFDEGLADGLLAQGRTAEAAERLADEIKGIRDSLSDIDFAGAFDVSDVDFGDIEDPSNDLAEISENIREQTRQAVEDANAELENLFKRDQAIARLDQFGDFDRFRELVESGAADANLDTIINAPNEALFAQIERDLAAASAIDPNNLVDTDTLTEQGRQDGEDIGLSVLEGQVAGYESGAGAVNETLAKVGREQIRILKATYGIASPSKVTFEIGEQLDEGLALGLQENDYALDALASFKITAEQLLSEEERELLLELFTEAGAAASAVFAAQLGSASVGTEDSTGSSQPTGNPAASASTGSQDSSVQQSIRISVRTDVDDSDLDALESSNRRVRFSADLDDAQLEAAVSREYEAQFETIIDTTVLDEIESRTLNIRGNLTVASGEFDGFTFTPGGVFDKGGVAYEASIFGERRPEFAAGPHHTPEQVVGWMDELHMSQGVAGVLLDRYRTYSAPQVTQGGSGFDAVVTELAAVKNELAGMKTSSTNQEAALGNIAELVNAGSVAGQQIVKNTTVARRGRNPGFRI